MHVRPSYRSAFVLAACLPLASVAFAQNGGQPEADGGAPIASTNVAPPPPPPPTVTAVIAQPPPPVVPTISEQEPLRLGRLVELEADRARTRRYGASAVEMIVGVGGIISGSLAFAINTNGVDPTFVTLLDTLGVVSMVVGGLAIIDGVVSLIVESPMERMFDRYAPVAVDKTLSAADRVHRGEQLLESMAALEHTQRTTSGAGALVIAGLEVGLAIFFAADNDLWANDTNAGFDRPVFATLIGLGAVSSIGEALAKLIWERGPAEVAWEHWHTAHEIITVQTARVHVTPTFTPIRGGATAGLSLRF